jgi:hypothetical protein
MVSAVGLARLGDDSLRAGPKVSGRKISFPELLFAKAGAHAINGGQLWR